LYLFICSFSSPHFPPFQAFVSGEITEVHFSVPCFSAGGLKTATASSQTSAIHTTSGRFKPVCVSTYRASCSAH
jgi:hypothetical protein